MRSIGSKLHHLNFKLRQAENAAGRKKYSVQLLAVSKTKSCQMIIKAYQAGQRLFGESYLQEALLKQQQLANYQIEWHFIGPIQSNKTRQIAENFAWVHSVDRLKIARRLSEQRPQHLAPLNICIQINISDEATKSGFLLSELEAVIIEIKALPGLCLKGVMAIPERNDDYAQQRLPYKRLYQTIKALPLLRQKDLNTFSFGMSNDLEAAVAEGSTIVRVGTDLFGQRDYSNKS